MKDIMDPVQQKEDNIKCSGDLMPTNSTVLDVEVHGFQNDSQSPIAASDPKERVQDDFFNSYISNPADSNEVSSTCSDSVSRCGENHRENNASRVEKHSHFAGNAGSHALPHPWYSQIQSDSSSLVTLVSERKMSDSRRTFCLFVTFDFILTVLLWLIDCGTSASSEHLFFDIVRMQIQNFSINTSLFDVVCLAAVRFAFLEVTYAAVRIRHWWAVAVSTSVTDILLILKIFPIFANTSSPDFLIDIPMTVVLLLTNFVLSWIEVWFIDFKVLPAEAKLVNRTVKEFLQHSQHQNSVSFHQNEALTSEKAPLLQQYRAATPPRSYYTGVTSDQASYHSIPESDFHSTASDRTAQRNLWRNGMITQEEGMQVQKGQTALNQLWSMFRNEHVWKLEKQLENGDKLYTTHIPGYGKTFRIDTVVYGVSAQKLFQEVIVKAENMPTWNKAVSDVKIMKRIGDQTAISLEVSKPAANGLIKSRDFITVRRVDKCENSYISAGVSTDFQIPHTGRIRGENGPTGFIVQPCEDEFNSCKFTWILNTNLKGSLPQYLVNSNLMSTMTDFVSSMKNYLGAES